MTERARRGVALARALSGAGRVARVARVVAVGAAVVLAVPGCGQAGSSGVKSPAVPGQACPARVAAAALSAVRFFTASGGVGVWPGARRCGARLAVTRNAGRTWRLTSASLPGPPGAFRYSPVLAFPNPRLGWADGAGVLDVTRDGGATWAQVRLGGQVQAISLSGTLLWAFVAHCPGSASSPASCRSHLDQATLPGASWHPAGLLPRTLGGFMPLVVARLAPGRAVVAVGQMSPWPAYLTTDGGATWTAVRACVPAHYSPVALATTGPRLAWALCLGGSAAGSSVKSLTRSADAGHAWHVVAEDRGLAPGTPSPVPLDPGDVLAAPTPSVLWFAGVNGLAGSTDGGRTWFGVPAVSTAGAGGLAALSFISPARGWLLVPGAGLWQTTDGRHWQRVSSSAPDAP